MSRSSRCTSYVPSAAESDAIVARLGQYQPRLNIATSVCAACPRVLEEFEQRIRGYASGVELGLCANCASYVNTQANIEAALKDGATVFSGPIGVRAAKGPTDA